MAKRKPTLEELRNERIAKSFTPGTGGLSIEQKAKFDDTQNRTHKAIDFKYGLLNPLKFIWRMTQITMAIWVIGYILQESDSARSKRELDKEIVRRNAYYQYDHSKPIWEISEWPKEGGKVLYHDLSTTYDVTKEKYYNGLPGKSDKKTKSNIQVKIEQVGHGKYPNEYRVEYKDITNNNPMDPHEILDQIDQEDIIDYMDGNLD